MREDTIVEQATAKEITHEDVEGGPRVPRSGHACRRGHVVRRQRRDLPDRRLSDRLRG